MGCHLVMYFCSCRVNSSVAHFWRLIPHQDNYSDTKLCAQSLVHLSLCLGPAHPYSHTAPQPRIRWDNLVMAAKHTVVVWGWFTIARISGILSSFSEKKTLLSLRADKYSSLCLSDKDCFADLTNGFSLPKAEFSFCYYLVYKPPWFSSSSPVPALILQKLLHPVHPHPAVSSSQLHLIPTLHFKQNVRRGFLSFPSNLYCKSWVGTFISFWLRKVFWSLLSSEDGHSNKPLPTVPQHMSRIPKGELTEHIHPHESDQHII